MIFSVLPTGTSLRGFEFFLEHETLTEENYFYAQKVLNRALENAPNDTHLLKLYARLCLAKNQRERLSAGRSLRHAMTLAPEDAEIFHLYAQVCGTDRTVFRMGCEDFVRNCKAFLKEALGEQTLWELLIPALIECGRYADAEESIRHCEKKTDSSLPLLFRGDLELARGNVDGAEKHWSRIKEDDHKGQYEIGERFLRLGNSIRAEEAFERSFAAAKPPLDLSALYSLAFLYDRQENHTKAAEMWQKILHVLASDWQITDGETVEWAKRELARHS